MVIYAFRHIQSNPNILRPSGSSPVISEEFVIFDNTDCCFTGGRINSSYVWMYNSQLNLWIRVASLNKGRWRHKMSVLLGKVGEELIRQEYDLHKGHLI